MIKNFFNANKKRHIYCFSYIGNSIVDGQEVYCSCYVGCKKKGFTRHMIDSNKIESGVDRDAVLLSTSYLGYMDIEEFLGK